MTCAAVACLQTTAPTDSFAELLSSGRPGSESYRLGFAIAAIVTVKSPSPSFQINVFGSDDKKDEVQLLLDHVTDFALVDQQIVNDALRDRDFTDSIRGVAIVLRAKDGPLMLVTRDDVAERYVRDVAEILFGNIETLTRLDQSVASVEPFGTLNISSIPIHPGVARFEAEGTLQAVATNGSDVNGEDTKQIAMSAMLELLTRQRDALIDEVDLKRVQLRSVTEEYESNKQENAQMKAELASFQGNLDEATTIIAEQEEELGRVTIDRDRLNVALAEANKQLESVWFKGLDDANKTIKTMSASLKTAEARYQEAVGVAEACMAAHTGQDDTAYQILQQVERLETELAQCRDQRTKSVN